MVCVTQTRAYNYTQQKGHDLTIEDCNKGWWVYTQQKGRDYTTRDKGWRVYRVLDMHIILLYIVLLSYSSKTLVSTLTVHYIKLASYMYVIIHCCIINLYYIVYTAFG